MFGVSKSAVWAFGVHILTASGAFLAFLSIVSAAEYDFPQSFFWLGMALVVDGIDDGNHFCFHTVKMNDDPEIARPAIHAGRCNGFPFDDRSTQ